MRKAWYIAVLLSLMLLATWAVVGQGAPYVRDNTQNVQMQTLQAIEWQNVTSLAPAAFTSVTESTVTITGSVDPVNGSILVAADPQTTYFLIVNTTSNAAYLSLSGTATTTKGIPLYSQGSSYELKCYQGPVAGNVASGQAAVLYVTRGYK